MDSLGCVWHIKLCLSLVNTAVHLPEFWGKPLDLYTLYQAVDEHGGLQQVLIGFVDLMCQSINVECLLLVLLSKL